MTYELLKIKKGKKKYYFTKKRMQQYRYWKILIGVSMICMCVLGAVGEYSIRYTKALGAQTVVYPRFIPRVQAKETVSLDIIEAPTETTETVEQMIRRLAEEANFKWPDYLVKLAKCESSLNPNTTNDKNNNPSHSKDRGLYQINNYWHSEVTDAQAYNAEWATKWTMNRINNGYQHEWACDRIIKK